MPNHAYRAASAPSVVQRARNTRTGRKLERGGYLTVETVTMWIVYALRSEERRVGKECRSRWSPYH